MILLQLDGITGDSQISSHVGWIGIDSCQFGVGRGISSTTGGADRDTSTPSFSEVVLTKPTDLVSTQIFAQAAYGEAIGEKCTIHFIQTAGKDSTVQVYMEVELYNPIISSYSVSSGGDRPVESFSINFTKIGIKFQQFKDGKAGAKADPKGFDLGTGTAWAPT